MAVGGAADDQGAYHDRAAEILRDVHEREPLHPGAIHYTILSGWIAHVEGDAVTAVARVREAVELEPTVEKHPITPGALLPPTEALGDLLMQQDRPDEALSAYERSLEIWPNRYHSLLGAARAASAADRPDRARGHYDQLLQVAGSDADRPGVREARQQRG